MNFLSVLYAKAGITVDGVTELNNTATALTPTTSDSSTKIATTAFVKNQNYYPYPTGTTSQYVRGDGSLATFPTVAAEAKTLITEVYNETGATLTKGTVVYINGGHGNLPTITKALANSDATSAQTYGVVQNDITDNNNGFVVVIGSLIDLDTFAYANGTILYLSPTTAGAWTSTKPYAPQHIVYVGIVVRSHPTQGVVEIKIQNGYEMDELHNVSAQSPANGDILQFNYSTQLWTKTAGTTTNITEGTNLYYTDARSRAAFSEIVTGLEYNSTTGVLSLTTGYSIPTTASQSTWNTAYNDSIVSAAVTGTTTKTLTLTQQDGGTITASWSDLNTDAVTSVFGRTGAVVAASGDYTTTQVTEGTNLYFTDARARAAISLTTTGTSGAATYSGGVLNIPQYQAALTNPVTGTGTTNYLPKFTGTSTLGDSSIFDNGTNVGIGTTTPGYKFSIEGTAANIFITQNTSSTSFNRSYFFNNNGIGTQFLNFGSAYAFGTEFGVGQNGSVLQSNTTSAFAIGTSTATPLYLGTNGTERMRITSAGLVGIGTTSPSQKVTIGNGTGTGNQYVRIVASGSDIYIGQSASTLFGQSANSAGYVLSDNTSFPFVLGTIAAQSLIFGTNTAERMRIFSDGNVAINSTTNAGYKLDVNGTGRFTSTLYVSNTNGTGIVNAYSAASVGTYIAKSHSATANFVTTGVSYPRGLGYGAIVGAGNTTDIPVKNSAWSNSFGGNIGFWSDVHYGVEGGTNSVGYNAVIRGSGDSTSFGYFADLSGATGAERYGIYTKGEAKNYFSGNVGIGTTSPSYKLDVSATGYGIQHYGDTNNALRTYAGGTYQIIESNNSGVLNQFGYHSGFFYIETASTERMRITSAGNVGIGTASPYTIFELKATDPVQRFSVSGGVTNNKTYEIRAIGASGYEGLQFRAVNDANSVYDTLMFLARGGNVLIGTTTDSGFKLDVNGTARVTSSLTINSSVQSQVIGSDGTYGSAYPMYSFTGISNGYHRIFAGTGDDMYFASATSRGFQFRPNGSSTSTFVITSVGNVGIGTTTPASITNYKTLTLDATDGSFTEYRQNGTALFRVGADGSRPFFVGITNANMDFYTNSTLRMTIAAGGNLGINTSSPSASAKLHIVADSSTASIFLDAYGTRAGFLGRVATGTIGSPGYITLNYNMGAFGVRPWNGTDFYSGGNTFISFNSSEAHASNALGGRIQFQTTANGTAAGVERMRIENNGNVLIGTTTDAGYRLDVSGATRATDFYTDGWFRNSSANKGLYNSSYNTHLYSRSGGIWSIASSNSSLGYLEFWYRYYDEPAAEIKGSIVWSSAGFGLLNNQQSDFSVLCNQGTSYGGTLRGDWNITGANLSINSEGTFTYSNITYSSSLDPGPYNWYSGVAYDGVADETYYYIYYSDGNQFRLYVDGTIYINGGAFSQYSATANYISVGNYGLYSATYSSYIRTNTTSSYGAWDITGSKGGYTGLLFNTSNLPHFMFNTSNGYGGLYYQTGSRWVLYYDYTNNCLGVGQATTSSSYKLYVTGAIYATGAIVANSDGRNKENVEVVENALDKVNSLRGVTYTKKDQDSGKREMGVIAQEVLPHVPEVIQYAEDLDQYGVSYGNFAGLFIEAIKEQQVLINELKVEIEILKNK